MIHEVADSAQGSDAERMGEHDGNEKDELKNVSHQYVFIP